MNDGMARGIALALIDRLRDFTGEEYAGSLLHVGDGRYAVGYRSWVFQSTGAYFDWQQACMTQNTLYPVLAG